MKKLITLNLLVSLLFVINNCNSKVEDQASQQLSKEELTEEIEFYLKDKLLHIWYPRMVDKENGGYYTNFNSDWTLMETQPKMIVSQARGLWTASKAAELFPDDPRYLDAAHYGFTGLRDTMWDYQKGGFHFFAPNPNEAPSAIKQSYGIAFGIYGLAAYYKLTSNPEALELAKKAFFWLDEHAHDAEHGGYYDILTREGLSALSPDFNPELLGRYGEIANYKDYNSSIHILEAFAELYVVWKDELLKDRLREMLLITRDKIIGEKGYMSLYFEKDWTAISFQQESDSVIKQNFWLDHVTFGHDIETAYLLLEAAEVLGEEVEETEHFTKKMVDLALENGFDEEYKGVFDGGNYFQDEDKPQITKGSKNWWSQAEALNTLLIFAKHYPDEPVYMEAFQNMWAFCKEYAIDKENGGWYEETIDVTPSSKNKKKGHVWKSNYHTGRSLMNCYKMLHQ
ncbi:AGE family epimerase/isomerase [Flammeovirgaceae bacterium SG7u.111]|nr:AGE family epimerase/isomerase [Flammeovirgaceae bacterium SG7u.132]WPO33833.1 AGE family epimerase/isomerase [Flammeovirgaceae bacterium SG7u.111]